MSAAKVSRTVFSGNALRESVSFRDENGTDFVPTTVEFKVINREDDSLIQDWTSAGTPAADMDITFDGAHFATEFPAKASEIHEVTLFVDRQESGFKRSLVYEVEVIRSGEVTP